ncbi:MAG: choline-sulfatase [Pseudohongiellaceae bacterium]|jgi:choline-sulfatase
MKWSLVIFIAAVTTACSELAPTHPNVVVVLVDTLRADRLGAHGSQRNITPKLDALAAQSVVFSRAIAPANWTKPSVASLFTGLYPERHGAVASAARDQSHSALAPQLTTLAEVLGDAGFDTAAFITNPHINVAGQFDQGFGHFVQPAETAVVLVNQAGTWLDERANDRPFFLYLHLIDPHSPYDPPPNVRAALAGCA